MVYMPRDGESHVKKWLRKGKIVIIRGPRQAGKTTLMKRIREEMGGTYITFDNPENLSGFYSFPLDFAKRHKPPLFIDEAQYAEDVGRALKFIYDELGIPMAVSGSGSFDVKTNVGGYLVGRAIYHELLPLSFREFVAWKAPDILEFYDEMKEDLYSGSLPEVRFQGEFKRLFNEYSIFGGYPEVVLSEDKGELLRNIATSYLERDVGFFFGIREGKKFMHLARFLADNMSRLLVMSHTGIDYKTLQSYLFILESTYIIRLLEPFTGNRTVEMRKMKKIQFIDTGFRNAVIGDFSPFHDRKDRGQITENFVFRQIMVRGETRYWRTRSGAEVDFVLLSPEPIPIEVKSGNSPERGFFSFIKRYRPSMGIVFSDRGPSERTVGKTKVIEAPVWMA